MLRILAIVCLLACAPSARAADAPPALPTCSTVRAAIEKFGMALVMSMARARGHSDEQIERVRRSCRIGDRN